MDDVNINEICVEEVEVIADGDEWIKLNWIDKQSGDNETSQSLHIQKEDSNTETSQTKDNDSKVSSINTESEDISDGISVITESDTDTVTNILQICRFNGNASICGPLRMLETQSKQANIRNVFMACVVGIIIGFILSYSFIAPETNSNSNGINIESLETVSHNIVNSCKALAEVKTVINEIKRTAVDKKIMEHIGQLFKINSANKMDNKPIITSESFNFDQYSLDQVSQLQMSLYVLSSLAFIYDNNSSLKNDISETLDIVNSTKSFYENLILFNNSTQNEYNSLALKSLQYDNDKIHITSKSLLSNLIEKMSKITLRVYNKYTKEKYKLIKKLCNLKNVLPDDEFLKQLTENNQLFKNYDKSCFSNYSSNKLNTNTIGKRNTKIKNVKKQIRKADNTVIHAKYDKESYQKIYDGDRKSSLKKKSTKRLNEHSYATTKFFQNDGDKIYNTSQLLFSDSIEKMNEKMLNKHTCTRYNEATHEWLKNKRHKDSNVILEQSAEDGEENNRDSVNWSTKENDYLQLIGIQKDMCPLSTNCPEFNIDVPTLLTASSCKTENCIVVNSNNKPDANSKESVLDYESSAKVLFEKNRSKEKDYSKSSDSTKKVFNNDNKNIKGKKKIFPQNEMKNHMSEHTVNYHKSKRSSFNSHATKQDDQDINMDWLSDNERFYARKKQRQHGASDWYFQRVRSRRNARKHAEDIYQRNNKQFWKKRR